MSEKVRYGRSASVSEGVNEFACSKEDKTEKDRQRGEKRENENKWQAGLGVMHNSYIKCSDIVGGTGDGGGDGSDGNQARQQS